MLLRGEFMKKHKILILIALIISTLLYGCGKEKDDPVSALDNTNDNKQEETANPSVKSDDKNKKRVKANGTDDEEEDDVKTFNRDAEKAFMAFASDEELCISDVDRDSYFRKGNRYSLSEIIDTYLKLENAWDSDNPVALFNANYAYVDCGNDGREELALNLEYGMNGFGDYSQDLYMFYYADDGVHLFAWDTFGYRTLLEINEKGYVIKGGSGGASLYCEQRYYFDPDHKKVFLYSIDKNMGLEYPRVPKYYIRDGFNRTDYPDNDYSDNGYDVYTANFGVYPITDNPDEDYYEIYYKDNFYSFCTYNDEPVRPEKEMIEFYADEGIEWYDFDEFNEKLDDHELEMGVTEEIKNADKAEFKSLIEEDIIKHEYYRGEEDEEGASETVEEVKDYTIHDVDQKPYISDAAEKDHPYSKVTLKQISCTENGIIDREEWFKKASFTPPGNNSYDDKYNYVLTGDAGYGTMTIAEIYDRETGNLKYRFDLSDLLYAKGYEGQDFVDRGIRHCFITDNYLYLNIYHPTYAESCPDNAFIMCIDINTGETVWVSQKLTSNSCNFVRWGDNIITGYGFTAEDDYIYILNRFTGEVTEKIKVKKSPDYFAFVNDELWERTYSYDYVFSIKNE